MRRDAEAAMTSESPIDRWLDLWEELEERGELLSESEFVRQHCADALPLLVDEFRRQLRRLRRAEAKLAAAAVSDTPSSAAPRDEAPSRDAQGDPRLRAGLEPVPGYVLQSRLGRGGFGEVWRATAPGGHAVALKFIRLEKRVGEAERRSLDVMRHVRHPHLLSCHGSWEVGRTLVVAMDLADRTLLDRFEEAVRQGHAGIPARELLGYMEEAAKGIDHLNEPRHPGEGDRPVGIQHRDVKPQNLLLQGGSVRVADFGLARLIEHSLTGHTGSMTPAYAAPEFFQSRTSRSSDQYSLAVTYCHLRGGRLPFSGNESEVMAGHLRRKPDLSMLPPGERPAVARALAKNPRDRWPNCAAFVAAVREAQSCVPPPLPVRGRQGSSATPVVPSRSRPAVPPQGSPETVPLQLRRQLLADMRSGELRQQYLTSRTGPLAARDAWRLRRQWLVVTCLLVLAVGLTQLGAIPEKQYSAPEEPTQEEVAESPAGGLPAFPAADRPRPPAFPKAPRVALPRPPLSERLFVLSAVFQLTLVGWGIAGAVLEGSRASFGPLPLWGLFRRPAGLRRTLFGTPEPGWSLGESRGTLEQQSECLRRELVVGGVAVAACLGLAVVGPLLFGAEYERGGDLNYFGGGLLAVGGVVAVAVAAYLAVVLIRTGLRYWSLQESAGEA